MLTTGGILGMGTGGRWWALFGLYTFTASYSVSLGALVWVLVAEVFPTCHRAQAISIVSTAHFAACAIVVVMLPLAVREKQTNTQTTNQTTKTNSGTIPAFFSGAGGGGD